ncbi:EF-hand domain-containing protein [Streptomyces sp. IBSNAI002]|uniref:EF-hand domain-containing protein n=1 Tax=Streptomyces sp. IBSNAI002 TaxID=3457500 RepID=UPI003FD5208D
MGTERLAAADRIFDRLDTDGDGVLAADDYRASADRMLQSYGMGPGSPKGRALIEANQAVWQRQAELVDRDHDGRITREEYREWVGSLPPASASGKPSGSPEVMAALHAQFHVADRDGDGLMNRREFMAWRGFKLVPEEAAEAAFALVDADRDGAISWDDFNGAEHRHGLAALLYGPGWPSLSDLPG